MGSAAENETATTSPPPLTRGRPRSTSISNGSPGPAPTSSTPLPSLFPDTGSSNASARKHWPMSTSSGGGLAAERSTGGGGWGHRPSPSVPGIVSPLPVVPDAAGRVNRHRRTQSVSPPGFPIISGGDVSGFGAAPALSLATDVRLLRKASSSRERIAKPIPISTGPPPPPPPHPRSFGSGRSPTAASTSPHSPNPFSPSTSPNSLHHFHSHGQASYPSSHAALLSGVRSHALPHSPTMELANTGGSYDLATSTFSYPVSRPPVLASAPQSPPFGPTPATVHFSSPLALEVCHGLPDGGVEEMSRRRGEAEAREGGHEANLPGAFDSSTPGSPPLLSSCLGVLGGAGGGRARAGSFGRVSPPSPAMLYLETEEPSPFGQCDMRTTKTEQRTSSPPPSPPLFLIPAALPSVPSISHASPPATLPLPNRPRSRSFTSNRNFAPDQPISTPPPPPFGLPSVLPEPALAASPASEPLSYSDGDLLEAILPPVDLVPPPSPHHATIALPPPLVAPAPLPPHLGGPPLHHVRLGGSKLARAQASSSALASKLAAVVGTEHVPKRHSPLASPSITGEPDDREGEDLRLEEAEGTLEIIRDERGQVEKELSEAEGTGMDLGLLLEASRPLSPCGSPEHQEVSTYLSLHQDSSSLFSTGIPWNDGSPAPLAGPSSSQPIPSPQILDFDEGFASSSPPRHSPAFQAVVSHGPEGDTLFAASEITVDAERTDLVASGAPQVPLAEPCAALLVGSDYRALGFMDVDGPSALGLETGVAPGVENEQELAIDEESLSSLERIFVCAKSETTEERARVAHHLVEWLATVDICEAVEYVLPLLAGLATDTEELVKEVFSPQLDRIMWHFFSQCPLLELDATSETNNGTEDASPAGSPVPSRYPPLPDLTQPSPASIQFYSDESGSIFTPPSTSKTSPSNTEVSDVPRISATTFTSLLGALLTDQSTIVAKSTQASLVRFLCRLKGTPLPPGSEPSSPATFSFDLPTTPLPHTDFASSSHQHPPYHLSLDACRILEDEFVTGIVLGLARLDDEERDGEKSMEGLEDDSQRASSSREGSSVHSDENRQYSSFVLSPEEDQLDDGWLASIDALHETAPGPTAEAWGEPLVSYFDDGLDHPKMDQHSHGINESPPAGPMYSTFSPDGHGDEESAIGKMVSMSLIAAIAMAGCLEPDVLVQHILPEVDRMRFETMFYVRKEAMQALGCLARTLPLEIFESSVLPLHAAFARDSLWHVRRAACLALPQICKRLPLPLLRAEVVAYIKVFSSDLSRNVRSGALEVCGELIYLFHGDPDGVPADLLAFFLGQTLVTPSDNSDNVFTPLQSALDSPAETFYDGHPSSVPNNSLFAAARDPDRPVMCAFNFPAVALTVGREQWHLLQPYYITLCRDKADKVRQSLASSLYEVAKIIGPAQADAYLLEPFSWYLRDFDHIQGAVLENISTLLLCFGSEAAKRALELLAENWGEIKNWRRREAVAKDLATLGERFVVTGAAEEVLRVVARAFKDRVAAVREQAVYALPAIFSATDGNPLARSKIWAFLSVFSEDSGYRNRMTYAACALAAVRGGVSRETFEAYFVDALSRLARDGVVNVRIGVARVIREACRSVLLYADPSSRDRIQDILHTLAHSHDRDVKAPIAEFYISDSPQPSPSPPRSGLDRTGAQSAMGTYGDDDSTTTDGGIPLARTTARPRYGIDDDDNEMHDVCLNRDDSMMADGDECGEEEDEDVEMTDEGVLLEAPSGEVLATGPSPQLWTRELEGEDAFIEVSRR